MDKLKNKILIRESKRSLFVSEVLMETKEDLENFLSFLLEKKSNIRSVEFERIQMLSDFLIEEFNETTIAKCYPEKIDEFLLFKDGEFSFVISTDNKKVVFIKSNRNEIKKDLVFLKEDKELLSVLNKYFEGKKVNSKYYKEVKKEILKRMNPNSKKYLFFRSQLNTLAKNMYMRQLQIKKNNNDFLSNQEMILYQNRIESIFFNENKRLFDFLENLGYEMNLENFNQTKKELMGGN